MDTLGNHKSAAIGQIVTAAGARLWFLPPYHVPNIRLGDRGDVGCQALITWTQRLRIEPNQRYIDKFKLAFNRTSPDESPNLQGHVRPRYFKF